MMGATCCPHRWNFRTRAVTTVTWWLVPSIMPEVSRDCSLVIATPARDGLVLSSVARVRWDIVAMRLHLEKAPTWESVCCKQPSAILWMFLSLGSVCPTCERPDPRSIAGRRYCCEPGSRPPTPRRAQVARCGKSDGLVYNISAAIAAADACLSLA